MAESKNTGPPPSWSQLLTPEALAAYGHLEVAAPTGEFDPHGAWTQCWQLYLLRKTSWERPHHGHIEITRRPDNNRVRFSIRQANSQGPQRGALATGGHGLIKSVCDTQADLICRADDFLTPDSWTLHTALRHEDGSDFEGTRLTKQMRIRAGRIELTCDGNTSARPLPAGNVTSNWGLLNVLSTVDGREPLTFTLLDELDKVKADHKLHRAADTQIAFGGRKVAVHCYHQIGRGTLPWEYYVDASTRRVLLALSGLRAYILDDSAAEKTTADFPGFAREGRVSS
jgi:hypothetical protein